MVSAISDHDLKYIRCILCIKKIVFQTVIIKIRIGFVFNIKQYKL
jgi:hypothetical protein